MAQGSVGGCEVTLNPAECTRSKKGDLLARPAIGPPPAGRSAHKQVAANEPQEAVHGAVDGSSAGLSIPHGAPDVRARAELRRTVVARAKMTERHMKMRALNRRGVVPEGEG